MSTSALSPMSRLAGLGPLVLRLAAGVVMAAHGFQKLTTVGPAKFGAGTLGGLGVPLPVFFGYVVTFAELVGGVLLVLGLLTRLAALVLTVDLIVAVALVKVNIGLIAPMGAMLPGAELDLALLAGFLAIVFMGPGKVSLDYAVGLESHTAGR